MLGNPLLLGDDGYNISRSVRLRSSATAWFSRAFAASGGTKWTYSGWVKRGQLALTAFNLMGGSVTSSNHSDIYFNSSDQLTVIWYNSTTQFNLTTTQVFRDPSAWYHIVVAFDSTDATSTNRLKVYVNGVQVTAFATASYPALNAAPPIYTTVTTQIGRYYDGTAYYGDSYLTEINFIDGQALTPSSFGETDAVTGVWKPKKYTSTYGTNGFYLNFSDNSAATAAAIGKDSSGNGNNWTPNNISVTAGVTYDSMTDVPTLTSATAANYATWNPLDKGGGTFASANLDLSSVGLVTVRATQALPTSGLWYWEVTNDATSGWVHGISSFDAPLSQYVGQNAKSWGYYQSGTKIVNGSGTAYGSAQSASQTVAVCFDATNGALYFGLISAGTITWQNSATASQIAAGTTTNAAFTGLTGSTYFPAFSSGATTSGCSANFGQRPFAGVTNFPTGAKALNTFNLPDSTIKKGNQYFDASLYTGTNASLAVTNGGFTPDLVWMKRRSTAASSNLIDSVRGLKKGLVSNLTDAEGTATSGSGLLSLDASGFTIGTEYDGGSGSTNASGSTYAAWQWKKGATQGFDIVTYTGNGTTQNIAHSLGVAPKMIITKYRGGAASWNVYHASLGATQYLYMDQTAAAGTSSVLWNNTAPTSSVFTVGSGTGVNPSGGACVAYLFAEVAGFSKFGSYTGNGSADGPFVYCGFRPRFLLVKRSDGLSDWYMVDTSRDTYNLATKSLFADLADAEGTIYATFDILSNGFKLRGSTTNNMNGSAATYIYAAFAENPFKNSLAR